MKPENLMQLNGRAAYAARLDFECHKSKVIDWVSSVRQCLFDDWDTYEVMPDCVRTTFAGVTFDFTWRYRKRVYGDANFECDVTYRRRFLWRTWEAKETFSKVGYSAITTDALCRIYRRHEKVKP